MSSTPPPAQTAIRSLRYLAFAVMSALALFTVVLVIMFGTADAPAAMIAIPVGASVLSLILIPLVRSKIIQPLPLGLSEEEARDRSQGAYRTAMFASFAIAETPALIGFATGIVNLSALPYVLPMAIAEVLLYLYLFPREATIDAVAQRLEQGGVRSGLREALGLTR